MDKETRKLIDEEIYPMVVTPIEKYIKPKMTIEERFVAKQKVFFRIKELLRGAEIATNLSVNEISEIIKSMIRCKRNMEWYWRVYEKVPWCQTNYAW